MADYVFLSTPTHPPTYALHSHLQVLDFGFPQLADAAILKQFIFQKGFVTEATKKKREAAAQSATLQARYAPCCAIVVGRAFALAVGGGGGRGDGGISVYLLRGQALTVEASKKKRGAATQSATLQARC